MELPTSFAALCSYDMGLAANGAKWLRFCRNQKVIICKLCERELKRIRKKLEI